MSTLFRRTILGSGVAGGLRTAAAAIAADGTFDNPDHPPQGAAKVTNPKALADPGPQDPTLAGNEPAFLDPPPTDVAHAAVLCFVQSRSQAHPERRLGTADYPA